MTDRRQILALSFFPAFVPPNNGGVERLYNLYASLAEHHDITLITSSFMNGEREVVHHLPTFTEIRIPKDNEFAAAYQKLAAVSGEGDLSGPALGVATQTFGALQDEYFKWYSQADVIIHDSPFLVHCDVFRGFDAKTRIYNSYNCETELYRSLHAANPQSGPIVDVVRELESDLCRNVQLITVCSDEDEKVFRRHFNPAAAFKLVPNGYVPGPPLEPTERDPRRVVFMGSAHNPNVDAVRVIVDKIAPKLPDVEFHLIGSCHAAGRVKNVIAHGLVSQEEKTRLLRSAAVAINPMLSGGGSSLKIADIASNGVPLLSTEIGARGFGLEPGVHYVAFEPANAVAALRTLLSDPSARESMARKARAHFEQHHSWTKIAKSLADWIEAMPARAGAAFQTKLVINDYDSFGSMGGGATRTRGLCQGLAETGPVIFLAFADDGKSRRRLSDDQAVLSVLVGKTPEHQREHDEHNQLHWVSTADVVNHLHAPRNGRLMAMFRCAASSSSTVICEHPYMAAVPRAFGVDFIYSSQNFEAGLKDEGLSDHPLHAQMLPLVREAEAAACRDSRFIVAVSAGDARSLSAAYRSTAPILVIANGAEEPAFDMDESAGAANERPVTVFVGSVHGPNYEAGRWIVTELAVALPDVDFVLIGSIGNSLAGPFPSNVRLLGEVDAAAKTQALYTAQVALNPMMSGSGSNVKMADYLQHGLPVLTTTFGARGYEQVPSDDAVVAKLEDFAAKLPEMLASPVSNPEQRRRRHREYAQKLSMTAGGRKLAKLIDEHSGPRKRALYVTYRYNDPALGGGEEYVDRLVHSLAASGWDVDIVSPAAERIEDVGRFGALYSGDDWQPTPTGRPRISSTKFPIDVDQLDREGLRRIWNFQSAFEEHVARHLNPPARSCLAWGWADPQPEGRWGLRTAGIFALAGGTLTVQGRALQPGWLQLFSDGGTRLLATEVENDFALTVELPPGLIEMRFSMMESSSVNDERPLALFVSTLEIDGKSLLDDRIADLWTEANGFYKRMRAQSGARRAVRDVHGLALSGLRGGSTALEDYVRDHVADYDLVVTHNAVFSSTTAAIDAAVGADVPSIFVPHLHYDDDFYHFADIIDACAAASTTLVCPRSVAELLREDGLANVQYFTPGMDVGRVFSDDDVAAFRRLVPEDHGDFFLILGRKAGAKGYRDIIAALDQCSGKSASRLVMIGPDDDGAVIDDSRVQYLGRQPDDVVRGAMRECLGLINMSRSESFGMVLLEAGLAGKPVIANRNCAAFADLVGDGENGFLVSTDDLPARMAELRSSPALRRRLGKEGRKRALRYDWAKVEENFVAICNSLTVKAK